MARKTKRRRKARHFLPQTFMPKIKRRYIPVAFYKYQGAQKHLLAIYNTSKGLINDPNTGQPQRFDATGLETLRDLRDAFKSGIGSYMLEMERLSRTANEIETEHMRKPDTPKYMQAVKKNNDALEKLSDTLGKETKSIVVGDNVHSHVKACVTDQKAWVAGNEDALDFALECIRIVKEAPEVKSVKEAEPESESTEPEETEALPDTEAEEVSEDEPEPPRKVTKLPPPRQGTPLRSR